MNNSEKKIRAYIYSHLENKLSVNTIRKSSEYIHNNCEINLWEGIIVEFRRSWSVAHQLLKDEFENGEG